MRELIFILVFFVVSDGFEICINIYEKDVCCKRGCAWSIEDNACKYPKECQYQEHNINKMKFKNDCANDNSLNKTKLENECASSCFDPDNSLLPCYGNGYCENGTCRCLVVEVYDEMTHEIDDSYRYSGKYCEECPYCPGKSCSKMLPCVECLKDHFGSNNTECDILNCTFALNFEPNLELDLRRGDKLCSIEYQPGCFFTYKYRYDINNILYVYVSNGDYSCYDGLTVFGVSYLVCLLFVILLVFCCSKWYLLTNDRGNYTRISVEGTRFQQVDAN